MFTATGFLECLFAMLYKNMKYDVEEKQHVLYFRPECTVYVSFIGNWRTEIVIFFYEL